MILGGFLSMSTLKPEVKGIAVGFMATIDPYGLQIPIGSEPLLDNAEMELLEKIDFTNANGVEYFTVVGVFGTREEFLEGKMNLERVSGFVREAKPFETIFHREECTGGCGKKQWFTGRRPTGCTYLGFLCDNCSGKKEE